MFIPLMLKLPTWAQYLVLTVFAAWAVALVVCWVMANLEIANMVAALGRAAGHRAFLQSLQH